MVFDTICFWGTLLPGTGLQDPQPDLAENSQCPDRAPPTISSARAEACATVQKCVIEALPPEILSRS
jgi:hypothetical protein